MAKRYKRIAPVAALTAAAAIYVLIVLATGSQTLCFWRTVTGLPCPGCGLTTALKALFRGDVTASIAFHPLLFTLPFVFAVYFLRRRFKICRYLNDSKWFYPSIFAAFILLFILRIILYFPEGPYPMIYLKDSVAGKVMTLFCGEGE